MCKRDHRATCARLVNQVITDMIMQKHQDNSMTSSERLLSLGA